MQEFHDLGWQLIPELKVCCALLRYWRSLLIQILSLVFFKRGEVLDTTLPGIQHYF